MQDLLDGRSSMITDLFRIKENDSNLSVLRF